MQRDGKLTLRRLDPESIALADRIREARSHSPAPPTTASDGTRASEIRPELEPEEPPELQIPPDWIKGQLLNVRNAGVDYIVTILGEEFDPRYPKRSLRFANAAECQCFVSHWYTRENSDPRAF